MTRSLPVGSSQVSESAPAEYAVIANGAAADDKDPPPPPPKDEDPDGMKLLQANDPLERAHRFVKPLEALCPDRIGVWLALYDINVRRGGHHRLQVRYIADTGSRKTLASCQSPEDCT